MIVIRFTPPEAERKALGQLADGFCFKSWAFGETLIAEPVLGQLAAEGIRITVERRAAYEDTVSALQNAAVAAVQ
jgi:hypothetical protein